MGLIRPMGLMGSVGSMGPVGPVGPVGRVGPVGPVGPLQQMHMNADASAQVYEKDVILGEELERSEQNEQSRQSEFVDKRAKTGDDIEREELSDD